MLDETLAWVLIVIVALSIFGTGYWGRSYFSSVRGKLRDTSEQLARLETTADALGKSLQGIEQRLKTQFDSAEAKVARLSTEFAEVRREALEIGQAVETLENKTDVAFSAVDNVKHLVEADATELKRIDDKIKDNIGKVNFHARKIEHLEDEVRGLEVELTGAPIRSRRDRHPE